MKKHYNGVNRFSGCFRFFFYFIVEFTLLNTEMCKCQLLFAKVMEHNRQNFSLTLNTSTCVHRRKDGTFTDNLWIYEIPLYEVLGNLRVSILFTSMLRAISTSLGIRAICSILLTFPQIYCL